MGAENLEALYLRKKRPVHVEMTRRTNPADRAAGGAGRGGNGAGGGPAGAGAPGGGGAMPIGEVAPADTYALDELLQQHQNEQAEASMRVPGQSTGLKHTSDPDSDDPTVKRMREERQAQEQYDVRIWTPFKMYEDEHLEQMEAIKAEEILKRAKVRAMDPKQKAEMRFHHDQLARTLQVAKIDASSTALGIGASSGAGTGSGV